MTIKGKAYIAGVFEHPTRKADDKSLAQPHAESARGALADAGLTRDDVDGYFCAGDPPGLGWLSMADYMGLKLRHIDTTETGGSPMSFTSPTRPRPSPPGHATSRSSRWPAARRGHGHRHGAAQLRGRAGRGLRVSVRAHRGQPVRDGRDRGARPEDLPAEDSTKFELTIKVRTAKQVGLTIPQSLLARADRVIE